MRINEIWNELENDKSLSVGLLLRRYAASVLSDVYVALRKPEKLRCIAIRVRVEKPPNLSEYIHLKDIHLEVVPDEKDSTKLFLVILLSRQGYNDVFAILCEDLINGIGGVTDNDKLLKELLNRLGKWKSLFDKAALNGLSPEEQRGLFGELYFLRKWISRASDIQECIQAWLGPEKELRDFQLRNWAIEVKTSHGNNHQKVHINSERQLDTSSVSNLLLYHLSLETQPRNGEGLNQIVNSIIELLDADIIAQIQFRSKLLLGGYFFHHIPLYEDAGYRIRQETFYCIRDTFPRIEEKDIRNGIGDVKYSIILSEQTDYLISEPSVFELIG